VTDNFLVIGCPTCQGDGGNFGFIRLYTPDTMVLMNGVLGSSGYQDLGEDIVARENTGGAE